jgi:hypothetical protein
MIKIIGCDFHPGDQADCDVGQGDRRDVGEGAESRKEGEVRAFYAGLQEPVRVGLEASGQSQWFERLLAELGHEGKPSLHGSGCRHRKNGMPGGCCYVARSRCGCAVR